MRWRLPSLLLFGILGLVASACAGPEASGQQELVGPVWIRVTSPWQTPPPDVELKERFASATLARFYADHRFALISCNVIEQGKVLSISVGDGMAVSQGEWHAEGGKIVARYQEGEGSVQRIGARKVPEFRAVAVSTKQGGLLIDGVEYRPAQGLAPSEFEQFVIRESR